MKHHNSSRPIGKCKGCCLNFRTLCMAGFKPTDQWDRGSCKHYNDKALLQRAQHPPAATGARLARLKRKARAALDATETHHNGVLDPGKMAKLNA